MSRSALTIRRSQLDALAALARPATVEKILDVLSRRHESLAADRSRTAARSLVARAVDRALDVLGFKTETGAADYAGLVFELGFEVEEDEVVAAIFARRDQTAEERLRAVFFQLTGEDWARLRRAHRARLATRLS